VVSEWILKPDRQRWTFPALAKFQEIYIDEVSTVPYCLSVYFNL